MIKTLSPYNVTSSFVSITGGFVCDYYTLDLYIWKGEISSKPILPTFSIKKINYEASSGDDVVNISKVVNSYIDLEPIESTVTGFVDGENQIWVQVEISYQTLFPADQIPRFVFRKLAVRGYYYGIEAANTPTPTDLFLMQGEEFKTSRNSYISVPVERVDTETATVRSEPGGEIDTSLLMTAYTDSTKGVKYIWINVSETTTDKYIDVTYNSKTITYYITEEHRYTPIDVFFFNKEGAQQTLTFFKRSFESMDVDSSQHEGFLGYPSDGYHQKSKYNINANTSITINSGYVYEETNQSFKQLLLSEKVWLYIDSEFIPVNVKNKTIRYKTQHNDRLINYDIEFEYAYNEINNL